MSERLDPSAPGRQHGCEMRDAPVPPRRRLPTALPLVLLLALAGCSAEDGASGGGTPPTPDTGPSTGDGDASGDATAATDVGRGDVAPADAAPAIDAGPQPAVCDCPHGPCVRREKDPPEPVCHPPCDPGGACLVGSVCLTFPGGSRCMPAGDRDDGFFCNAPSECAGGLCVWGGGGASACTRECSGADDATCGAGRGCLPSLTPPGSWHCYFVGELGDGEECLHREQECAGGYCLGQGAATYCSRQCSPAAPDCPAEWECGPQGDGYVCCDPWRTRGGSCGG